VTFDSTISSHNLLKFPRFRRDKIKQDSAAKKAHKKVFVREMAILHKANVEAHKKKAKKEAKAIAAAGGVGGGGDVGLEVGIEEFTENLMRISREFHKKCMCF
jgi:hypothetical protein